MVLSLIEVKEKLKPQLKVLLDVDDFKISSAEHKDNRWVVLVEYQTPEKGPSGIMVYYKTKTIGLSVDDQSGKIEAMVG